MASTILAHPAVGNYTIKNSKTSLFSRFLHWATQQEDKRLMWLGIALTSHGCILTPLTVFAVVLSGSNIVLFMLALIAMSMTLVTNLAAMPTKYTIPIFLFSILVDLGIVIACVTIGFNPGVAL